jgi:hypothetical protein
MCSRLELNVDVIYEAEQERYHFFQRVHSGVFSGRAIRCVFNWEVVR